MTLTVDGLYTEPWIKSSGSVRVLASSTVFVGGSEPSYHLPGGGAVNNNWVGCLKKVRIRKPIFLKKKKRTKKSRSRLESFFFWKPDEEKPENFWAFHGLLINVLVPKHPGNQFKHSGIRESLTKYCTVQLVLDSRRNKRKKSGRR